MNVNGGQPGLCFCVDGGGLGVSARKMDCQTSVRPPPALMEYSRCRPHPIPGERWTLAAYRRQMAHLVKTEQQAALLSVRGNRLSACVCAGPSGPAALTSKLALEWLVSLWREALQPGADFSVVAALHDFVTPQLQAAAPSIASSKGPTASRCLLSTRGAAAGRTRLRAT